MKQQDHGLNLNKRRTRKAVFLDEMNLIVGADTFLTQAPTLD